MRPDALAFAASRALAGLLVAAAPLACAGRVALPGRPAVAETFAIGLRRPVAVGARVRRIVEASKALSTRSGPDDPHPLELSLEVHFRAVEEVVSLTSAGGPLASRYVIEGFAGRDEEGERDFARADQVVTVVRAPDPRDATVTIDGEPARGSVLVALGLTLGSFTSARTDDEVFGTSRRQAVGAPWPIRGELALGGLRDVLGVPMAVEGQTRLDGRSTSAGIDYFDLSAEVVGRIGEPAGGEASVPITGTVHETRRWQQPAGREGVFTGLRTLSMEMFTGSSVRYPGEGTVLRTTLRERVVTVVTPLWE